jgi:hypothetical protein
MEVLRTELPLTCDDVVLSYLLSPFILRRVVIRLCVMRVDLLEKENYTSLRQDIKMEANKRMNKNENAEHFTTSRRHEKRERENYKANAYERRRHWYYHDIMGGEDFGRVAIHVLIRAN